MLIFTARYYTKEIYGVYLDWGKGVVGESYYYLSSSFKCDLCHSLVENSSQRDQGPCPHINCT